MNKDIRLREDSTINAMMDTMIQNDAYKDDSYVGCFWYDPLREELYGVYEVLAEDVPFTYSKLFDCNIKTGRKLHKDIWKKEQFKSHKDPRFNGDHTLKPRGRVFQLEDLSFVVMVGDWIKDYPEARNVITEEFQLPIDNTNFEIDEHWNLGHGFSDELL